MKTSLSALLLSSQLVSGAPSLRYGRRQDSSGCCFKLDSAGTVNEDVEEDHTGHLHLSGTFQQGAFCLQDGKVADSLGNQCFIKSPKYQFQCYQRGVVGDTVFDIVSAENGTTKLVYDSGPGTYLACSSDGGESYEIFSTEKPDTTGCLEVSLVLSDETGECTASSPVPAAEDEEEEAGDEQDGEEEEEENGEEDDEDEEQEEGQVDACESDVGTTTEGEGGEEEGEGSIAEENTTSTLPTTCSVSTSAPSLAPVAIGSPAKEGTSSEIMDTGVNASITTNDSTVFKFSIPSNFAGSSQQLCALQFRLPFCSELAEGYPCFQFTGSEQELSSNSGMTFAPYGESNELSSWNETALQQVYPGDQLVLGTFECGFPENNSGSRDISWLASSVRSFGLQFEQAGVGSSKFKDGVGAFIVQCS
ncbi:hypothetical protein PFICI_06658 [Pestalotiopsis fici W106-1]|uniref:Ubiquitin 3 binding protein But2 C-terminal domain-containing protein n=1 Tax=Pestalotiopsis fici (strain W106-1 / CGMCC3.15140) TaxID=1229662 RepID=W3X906_PESFW|nr:uncharacterized protein PFICI_06658 [Pestalotiopsis fici W106-1]ETS81656.1 hypothetical protein PFICI_06658 [Pestalotiopsis fici W106-1]